ncbi:glucose-1-phosphate adenylyltransferase subunit GlgD [Clostridium sp. SHJSY1]|uniref:glucose-1-phosphate adenylyltransferase subunit GlgD n=1 Tax=Clostridium sp. SHJSY1 TaxID=2942483 RepID=UPI00287411F9|nr:glucose-1-phosphate adenylyltransferase subunit GlgD [Clostridium sp. SHJSY1]MDS0528487.1 glucose-1-phosphate adenylyltransferase subunit GlgD [Clostridium sp. SHJSY1]
MNSCMGIINLDENESKMGELVSNRPLAAVPIAARYRIIDFVLSNMTNSGIECIGIFAKNKSRALMDHLRNGRPWDLHRKRDGLRVFNFGYEDPAFDDVHNFADNIDFIKYSKKEYIIMASSYMICNIDYKKVLEEHKKSGNDITMIYKNINNADKYFIGCNVLNINENRKLVSVGENIGRENHSNIDMEMYIMSTDLFIDIVLESIRSGMYRKIKQFISSNLDKLNVRCYEFKGYLACINSLNSYYVANMSLLKKKISNELFYQGKPIFTKTKDEAPTQYGNNSNVKNSIIANGCYIGGDVKNSIIGRRVHIEEGAKVEDCIILQNSRIGRQAKLCNVIADKWAKIGEAEIYKGSDLYPIVINKGKNF